MSGAESSRAASKRRRGPVPRPRGELDSPVQVQRNERTIRYSDVERVPTTKTRRICEHTLLSFELGTFESDQIDRNTKLNPNDEETHNEEATNISEQQQIAIVAEVKVALQDSLPTLLVKLLGMGT
ncbi:hypothetical protein E3N88_35149 [Mikania micrantha]|uniref:Uncharacterized protein n=1 Tax=Mikania micrantha TaxID=192012 RepID=A0A5N6M048_9ASTR|nr:hypothetical protein E3N88_35149 [Mikania micrantha]